MKKITCSLETDKLQEKAEKKNPNAKIENVQKDVFVKKKEIISCQIF